MNKALQIANGYLRLAQAKLGILPDDINQVAAMRLALCLQCKEFDHTESRCNVCGCYMLAKTKCEECECPLGKWLAYNRNKATIK